MRATAVTAAGLALGVLGYFYGFLRAGVALMIFAVIVYLGYSYFAAAGQVPPDVESEDVSDESLMYVCRMCGLELKIETVTTDRAPSHCREKMELVNVAPSPPPLRPV